MCRAERQFFQCSIAPTEVSRASGLCFERVRDNGKRSAGSSRSGRTISYEPCRASLKIRNAEELTQKVTSNYLEPSDLPTRDFEIALHGCL